MWTLLVHRELFEQQDLVKAQRGFEEHGSYRGLINVSVHVLYFFPESLPHLLTLAPDFYHTNLSSFTICQSRDMKSVQTSSMSQLHTWVCGPGMGLWLMSGLVIQVWVSGLGLT